MNNIKIKVYWLEVRNEAVKFERKGNLYIKTKQIPFNLTNNKGIKNYCKQYFYNNLKTFYWRPFNKTIILQKVDIKITHISNTRKTKSTIFEDSFIYTEKDKPIAGAGYIIIAGTRFKLY